MNNRSITKNRLNNASWVAFSVLLAIACTGATRLCDGVASCQSAADGGIGGDAGSIDSGADAGGGADSGAGADAGADAGVDAGAGGDAGADAGIVLPSGAWLGPARLEADVGTATYPDGAFDA